MAVTFDAVSTSSNETDPTSLTWSHTTTTNNNRIIVVGTSTESDTGGHTAQTVSGITYAGVALTKIRSDYVTDNGTELWYLIAPATGANNVVVSMTAVVDGLYGAAMTFSEVDQTSPIDANAGTTATNTSISQSLTTVAHGAMIVNILQHQVSTVTLTPDANQTQRFNAVTTGDFKSAGGTRLVTTATSYTTSWTNDASDAMTLSVVSLKPSPLTSSWSVSAGIQSDHTKVSGASDLTNFPVLIKDGNIPASVYSAMQSAGQDLRITTDSSGLVEIPFEIVSITPGSSLAEVWAKVPTLLTASATSLYLWAGNANAIAYDANAPFGSQAVWSSSGYQGVYHGNNTSDSTSNARNLGQTGTVNVVDSKIGKGFSATWDLSNRLRVASGGYNPGTGIFALQCIFKKNGGPTADFSPTILAIGTANPRAGMLAAKTTGYATVQSYDGSSSDLATSTNICDNTYRFVTVLRNSTSLKVYVDASASSTTGTARNINVATFDIGQHGDGSNYDVIGAAEIDEIRVLSFEPTADWIATEYANQNSPSTFWTQVSGVRLLGLLGCGT